MDVFQETSDRIFCPRVVCIIFGLRGGKFRAHWLLSPSYYGASKLHINDYQYSWTKFSDVNDFGECLCSGSHCLNSHDRAALNTESQQLPWLIPLLLNKT